MKENCKMKVTSQDKAEANNLYDTVRYIDRLFSAIHEGGSGVSYFGEVIPLDNSVIFAHLISGRNAYYSFRDFLEQSFDTTYHQLFALGRDQVHELQKSLPPSTVQEIFDRAQQVEIRFRATCQAIASAIKERLIRINLDYGSRLTTENLAHDFHSLCIDYSSLRHLVSDLRDSAWLDSRKPWTELEKAISNAIVELRWCFDWDKILIHEPVERSARAWSPQADSQAGVEEVKAQLSRAASLLESLREKFLKQVDDHFEFYLHEETLMEDELIES
jgi:hypothetical protein